jgi:hypothetical protein
MGQVAKTDAQYLRAPLSDLGRPSTATPRGGQPRRSDERLRHALSRSELVITTAAWAHLRTT